MITIIAIAVIIWGSSALIRASRQAKLESKREKAAQLERERNAKMRQEWREMQMNAKIEVDRMVAIEREQVRMREAERKQAEWNRKQEEINRKNDERMMRLEQRVALAEREIDHYRPVLEELEQRARELDNKVWWYGQKGLPCSSVKAELKKVNEQMYRVETKILKAEQARDFCEKQMSA